MVNIGDMLAESRLGEVDNAVSEKDSCCRCVGCLNSNSKDDEYYDEYSEDPNR